MMFSAKLAGKLITTRQQLPANEVSNLISDSWNNSLPERGEREGEIKGQYHYIVKRTGFKLTSYFFVLSSGARSNGETKQTLWGFLGPSPISCLSCSSAAALSASSCAYYRSSLLLPTPPSASSFSDLPSSFLLLSLLFPLLLVSPSSSCSPSTSSSPSSTSDHHHLLQWCSKRS